MPCWQAGRWSTSKLQPMGAHRRRRRGALWWGWGALGQGTRVARAAAGEHACGVAGGVCPAWMRGCGMRGRWGSHRCRSKAALNAQDMKISGIECDTHARADGAARLSVTAHPPPTLCPTTIACLCMLPFHSTSRAWRALLEFEAWHSALSCPPPPGPAGRCPPGGRRECLLGSQPLGAGANRPPVYYRFTLSNTPSKARCKRLWARRGSQTTTGVLL